MELYVLSNRNLGSITEWQRSIDDCGFPLQLADGVPFQRQQGFLPATLKNETTGFECDHWQVRNVAQTYSLDPASWTYAIAFRMMGSRISEVVSAYMAASAYARATRGAILDCEEGKIISAQRAAEIAQELELATPRLQEMVAKAQQSALKK